MDLWSEVDPGKVPDENNATNDATRWWAREKFVPSGHDGAYAAAQINGGLSSLKKGPSGMLRRSCCMRERLERGVRS